MHSSRSDQCQAAARISIPSGYDTRSVYSEDVPQSSRDPHQQYHPIHKEYHELGLASNQSLEDSHASMSRRSRYSISEDPPQLSAEVNAFEQGTTKFDMIGNDEDSQPTAATRSVSLPTIEKQIGDVQATFRTNAIPELIEKAWPEFMNRKQDDDEHAIEILVGSPDYYKGLNTLRSEKVEKLTRVPGNDGLTPLSDVGDPLASLDTRKDSIHPRLNQSPAKPAIPDRIRINSRAILNVLSKMDSRIDPTEPTIMLRPYKLLVHYEKEIRDASREADRQASSENIVQPVAQLNVHSHIACLPGFMDKYICPTLRRLADRSATKISFRDLWYIFQPGVDILIPLRITQDALTTEKKNITPQVFRDRYQILWRVSSCGGGRPRLTDSQENYDESGIKCTAFAVNAFYIDFDGRYFVPTHHTYFIQPFEGEKEITSLDFYPARFNDDGEKLIREHASYGEQIFRTVTEGHMHFYYSGYTMITHPCGCGISEGMHQEAVDSEVIIDTKAALLQHPSWQPQANVWKVPPTQADELKERNVVRTWSASDNKKLIQSGQDYIFDDNEVDFRKAIFYRDKTQIFKPIPSAWLSNARMVPEEDFHIFPGRVFAFVLRTRSFAPLWIWDLKPMRQQKESLSNLQLRDNSSKDILSTLVECHYEQAEHNPDFEYDVIRGKCKGLIILFHGVAGTGKTSTAESITAALGKPLFQITCGDLGTRPNEVEKALKQIFRYAQQWGCVLLLDECEIFLSRRTRNDINHNALVSVFLRTLELYTGVLFLTTNRVGVLDDAIKSRLTWTSYYPPLNLAQTIKIWETHIKMLKERRTDIVVDEESILKFANRHFERCFAKDCTWNGREIQNAFKVAVSLAEKDFVRDKQSSQNTSRGPETLKSPRHRQKLRSKHFKMVAKNMSRFHGYFHEATGFTEKERAWNAMERADDWNTEDTDSDIGHHNNKSRNERHRTLDADLVSWRNESPSPRQKCMKVATGGKYDVTASSPGGRTISFPKSSTTARRGSGPTSRVARPRRSSSNVLNGFLPVTRDDPTTQHSSDYVFGDMDGLSSSGSESDRY